MEGLEGRVAALEAVVRELKVEKRESVRALRLWKGIAGGVAALLLVGVLPRLSHADDPAGKTLQAPFRVTDAEGTPILEADAGKDGPYLRLMNAKGEARVVLYSNASGGNIGFSDKAGRLAGALTAAENGGALTLANHEEKPAAMLFSDKEGGAMIVYDKAGKGSGGLIATADGGNMTLFNAAEKEAVELMATPTGGKLNVNDNDGKSVFSKP